MIQRYEDYCPNPERDPCVLPLTDGKYVLFADHESEVAALRAEVERLRSALAQVREVLVNERGFDHDGPTARAIDAALEVQP